MRLQGRSSKACLVKCLVYRHFKKELLLDLGWNGGFAAKSGQSSKSPKCMRLTISVIHLGSVLDTVKVLKSIYPFAKRLSPPWLVWAPVPQTSLTALVVSSRRMPMKIQQSKRPGPPTASRRAPPSRALGESAGFSCDSGALSPLACRATCSTDHSRRTCRLLPQGKCRDFPRFWCTFHRGWCRKFGL